MTHRKSGARVFAPTKGQREQVRTLASFGLPQDDICRVVLNPTTDRPVSLNTLRRHFRQELDAGAAAATAKVVETLYRQAVGSDAKYENGRLVRAEQLPVPSAAMFWMRMRAKSEEASKLQREALESKALDYNAAPAPSTDELDRNV